MNTTSDILYTRLIQSMMKEFLTPLFSLSKEFQIPIYAIDDLQFRAENNLSSDYQLGEENLIFKNKVESKEKAS